VNGFIAETPEQWLEAVGLLASDPVLRRRMGEAGRQKVKEQYSLQAQAPRMVAAFENALAHSCAG
jgi:glycosyltransferase involved in cell wall biosynthesis